MPITYCPASSCAAEITYTGAKPTVCPKCKQPFAAAFQGIIPLPQVTAKTVVSRPAVSRIPPKPKRKRPGTLAARLEFEGEPMPMSPIGAPPEAFGAPQDEDDDMEENEEYDGGEADPDAINATASEILASLDPRDIIVQSIPDKDWGLRLTRPQPTQS